MLLCAHCEYMASQNKPYEGTKHMDKTLQGLSWYALGNRVHRTHTHTHAGTQCDTQGNSAMSTCIHHPACQSRLYGRPTYAARTRKQQVATPAHHHCQPRAVHAFGCRGLISTEDAWRRPQVAPILLHGRGGAVRATIHPVERTEVYPLRAMNDSPQAACMWIQWHYARHSALMCTCMRLWWEQAACKSRQGPTCTHGRHDTSRVGCTSRHSSTATCPPLLYFLHPLTATFRI
jgi:hypothetical protein